MKRVTEAKKAWFYHGENYVWAADPNDYRFKYDSDNKVVISKATATVYYNKQYETFYFDSDAEALAFAEEIKGKMDFLEIKTT